MGRDEANTIAAPAGQPRILAFATQGPGGLDEARLRALLERLPARVLPMARGGGRLAAWMGLMEVLSAERPDLVVMEGTGLAGGLAVLALRMRGTRYVVSTGDAVGPWVGQRHAALGPLFGLYERLLCRFSEGCVGWTPYLAGRALAFGAPRAMTAPGWAEAAVPPSQRSEVRRALRARVGIPEDALVVGLAGSLAWNRRRRSCYGLELVRALNRAKREDLHVLVVGDGEGRPRLEAEVAPDKRARLHLAGRVPREEVARWLCALDVASLPQSVDGVGSYRFTTKLPEYQAAGLPIVTGRLPVAYDVPGAWVRLPGSAPWDERHLSALAGWLDGLGAGELAALRERAAALAGTFSREAQVEAVTAFMLDILADGAA